MIGTNREALASTRLAPLLALVGARAAAGGAPAHLVGGAVRDLLLGGGAPALFDVDVAVEGPAEATLALAAALAGHGAAITARHERFGTATLATADGFRLDLATTRRETYPRPGALPVVSGGARIEEDLARRDFTVHAMASRIGADGALGPILDPFAGRADLDARLLRLLHPLSLADDPTRALRAARYAARLSLSWHAGFEEALEKSRTAGAWGNVSGDRLRRVLEEALQEPAYARAVELLAGAGVLDDILPGWGASLAAAPAHAAGPEGDAAAGATLDERWAALFAGLDPARRRALSDRLSFPRRLRRAAGAA